MPPVIPTKGNLMSQKRSLTLARLGYDLMDRKRNILIREMMSLIGAAESLQSQIDSSFSKAYEALQRANITLGQNICVHAAMSVSIDDSVALRSTSVMGVELPKTPDETPLPEITYGFAGTNLFLDEAYIQFSHVKHLTCRLAEIELSVYRLAHAIRKTQKRANALKNIIIPDFRNNIKFISDALEEKDREEFVRLKVIKRSSENKAKN
ncbi:MAG: V-type ATP synthase subunit D [Clostridiales bacterium]|nr:V-type ATP synthase subunit D [Clostridiales bacterium]